MEFEIKEIRDRSVWERFLLTCQEKTFLQSWNWGDFQENLGFKTWRLGIYQKGSGIAGLSLVVKIVAKRGSFLFVPHGPNIKPEIKNQRLEILGVLLEKLRKIAEEEKIDFIRIAPIWERDQKSKEIFKKLGFREAPVHIHPEVTWLLDISLPEEEILRRMRKNTRNLIRRAKREGVEVFQENSQEGVEKFNEIYSVTVRRHHFAPFSLEYLKGEFSAFSKKDQIAVFFAKHQGRLLASAMVIYWQKIGFYHQGASIASRVPAPYLLQWEAIKEAKRRGCQLYNFWGIVPEVKTTEDLKNPKIRRHPWWGLSLFKMGFGGYRKEYLRTQDLPLSFRYWLNYLVERARKFRRGY